MLLKEVRKKLNSHKKALFQYGVHSLAVFGSIARGEGTVKSDIDILVDFDSKKGLFGFVSLKDYLEKILQCEVDLVTKNALHPALKQKVLQEARHVL
jgi:hypothetical protein